MAVQIPFPLPSHGYALNSKMRVNLDFLVTTFNQFNTGAATWDTVGVGIANNETGTLTFYNSSNANYLTVEAGATAANITYVLPTAAPTNHGLLRSNHTGTLDWLEGTSGLLSSDGSGVMGFTLAPSGLTSISATTGTFTNISDLNSLGLKNISSPSFVTTIKAHTSTATSFDFYLPQSAGSSGQFLTSDGTKTQWTTFAPVPTGVAGYYAIYDGATIGASSSAVRDYFTFNTKKVRLAIADHGALGSDRTYTIPNVGANASFLMSVGDISTTGDIGNTGDSTKAIRSNNYIIYGYLGSGHLTLNYPGDAVSGNNYTLNFPTAQGGASQVMVNDGSGNLSWSDAGAGSVISGTAGRLALYPSSTNSVGDTYTQNSNLIDVKIATHAGLGASREYTIPNAGASSEFVMAQGDSTITGSKTFNGGISGSGDIATTGNIGNTSDATKVIQTYTYLLRGASSGILTINANATTTNHTIKFPATQGAANSVLQNDGSGNLSWTVPGDTTHATKALDNLASTAVNVSIIPGTDDSINLGSITKDWANVYATSLLAGRSGLGGEVLVYPSTASKGHISIQAINSAGDFTTIIRNSSLAASRIYSMPDAGADANFVMTEGTQTINGAKTFGSAALFADGNATAPGIAFSGATGTGIYRNGSNLDLSIAGQQVALFVNNQCYLGYGSLGKYVIADSTATAFTPNASNAWDIGTSSVLFRSGYFATDVKITATTNQFVLGTTRTATITAPTPATSSRTYTFPDLAGDYNVIGDIGNQTIGGTKTFSSQVISSATSNHLKLATSSNNAIISVATIATADRTITIPDPGTNANFVLSEGAATINGNKTFSGTILQTAQPSFLVTHSGATNVTGDATDYTVAWDAEVYDQGNNFASNTFTAPVTGRYLLTATVAMQDVTAAHTGRFLAIVTTNRTYRSIENDTGFATSAYTLTVTAIADMNANDTATVVLRVSGSTKVVDTVASTLYNYFSGSLIN